MQVVLTLSPGGTERLVLEICKRLVGRIDSAVCCLDRPGAWAAELEPLNIPVYALGRRPGFRPSLAVQIAALITKHHIDVLHCHHYSPFVYGLLASKLRSATLVFTEHGRLSDAPPSRKRQLVNPVLARLGGRIFAVSGALKHYMVAEGFPAKRIDVVYNGIDPGLRPGGDERARARRTLGLPDDAFVIGTAGRLDPVKNLGVMLESLALFRRTQPGAHAVIVGDGAELGILQEQGRALGVSEAVRFTGYRDDVRSLMPAFDVYLNCSRYEGVSLTILEAMASALPVVASPVGGNPEVVLDGQTGLLIPATPDRIASALTRLARDRIRRRNLGDAGRERVEQQFSITRMVNDYAGAYFGANHLTPSAPMSVPAAADATSATEATRSVV